MTDKTLKPCPFCSSTNLEAMSYNDIRWVLCNKCNTTGPAVNKHDIEEGRVYIGWNTRTDKHTPLDEAIEKVRLLIKPLPEKKEGTISEVIKNTKDRVEMIVANSGAVAALRELEAMRDNN